MHLAGRTHEESIMKTLRSSLFVLFLALGTAACGESLLGPEDDLQLSHVEGECHAEGEGEGEHCEFHNPDNGT